MTQRPHNTGIETDCADPAVREARWIIEQLLSPGAARELYEAAERHWQPRAYIADFLGSPTMLPRVRELMARHHGRQFYGMW